jgi:hypothetical protein
MKWRKSVGLGANAIWSTYPSKDWFIPKTSFAMLQNLRHRFRKIACAAVAQK